MGSVIYKDCSVSLKIIIWSDIWVVTLVMVVSWGGKTTCETVLTRSVNATRPPSSCCATMQEISVIFIYFIFVVYRKPCPNKRWWRKKKKQKACLYIHFYILDIIQFLPAAPEAWFWLLLVLNVNLIVWIQNVLLYYPLVFWRFGIALMMLTNLNKVP